MKAVVVLEVEGLGLEKEEMVVETVEARGGGG